MPGVKYVKDQFMLQKMFAMVACLHSIKIKASDRVGLLEGTLDN